MAFVSETCPLPNVELYDERLVLSQREDVGKRRRLLLILQFLQCCTKGFSVASIAAKAV